jgi:hypothetical protein
MLGIGSAVGNPNDRVLRPSPKRSDDLKDIIAMSDESIFVHFPLLSLQPIQSVGEAESDAKPARRGKSTLTLSDYIVCRERAIETIVDLK